MKKSLQKIVFNIISPDGFPFHLEPVVKQTSDPEKTIREEMEMVKERYKGQGYYSSVRGIISLDDLENNCRLDLIKGTL